MISLYFLFVQITSIVVGAEQYDEANFQKFYQMVEEKIEYTSNYVLPTNNSKFATVTDNKTYEYGLFDFIIVGAGAAGSVIANRLSEIEKWKILLLEAGGEQDAYSTIPAFDYSLQNSEMNWGYLSTPQKFACQAMFNFSCVSPRGKVLGGSTVLNANMLVRGNKEDYNNWARLGNLGWSYQELLPYFKKFENSHIPNQDISYRGSNGELDVSYFEDTFVTELFLGGMQELNYSILDYNGRKQIGASKIQSTLRRNMSATANSAFLKNVRNRPNLNVTTNALVNEILIDNTTKTALGVKFIKNGQIFIASAAKEVILSAGAINTPQLLILSGIGPEAQMKKLGIPPKLPLPAVGLNLQDHLMLYPIAFHTNQTLFNTSVEENLREYMLNHRPYTAAFNADCMSFINVEANKTQPDIQFLTITMPGQNFSEAINNLNDTAREEYVLNYDQFTDFLVGVVLLHPKSTGEVTLKSSNIADFPNIDYNYLSDPDDIETIHQGVLHFLKLLETEAFKTYNISIINTAKYCGDDWSREYWYCVIRHLATTIYHPAGTTAMGNSIENAVVDSELKVHGMRNLRVADAGIIPEITSGNIQAPVYVIGEKVSDIIKLEYLNGVL